MQLMKADLDALKYLSTQSAPIDRNLCDSKEIYRYDKLAQRGYVIKGQSPHGRNKIYYLSKKGQELYESVKNSL